MAASTNKRRLSFAVLLQSRKFLLIVSALLSIGVWWSVTAASVEEIDRTITLPYSVDLSGSYAAQTGLRLVEDSTLNVTVVVKGPWEVVSSLTAADLRVRADLLAVQKSGKQNVPLSIERNSDISDYEVVSFYPASAEIWCDYWVSRNFALETDLSSLSVADKKNTSLGTPVLDSAVAAGVVLSGPKSEADRVSKLVATVSDEAVLTDTRVFSATILAFDKDGAPVDISHCTFDKLTDHTVSLTVPVFVEKTLPIGAGVANPPDGYKGKKDLIKFSPSSLTLRGPEAALSALELSVGTIDFDTLRPDASGSCKFGAMLSLPEGVELANGETPENRQIEVTASISKNLTTKTFSFVADKGNVTFTGLTADHKASLSSSRHTVTLVGTAKDLADISDEDLTATVSLSEVTVGTVSGTLRISVSGADSVWAVYPAPGGAAVQVIINNK